jgi:hypothetical protein
METAIVFTIGAILVVAILTYLAIVGGDHGSV